MSWVDREEITRHLKVAPMELDSQEITASKRRRLYWTNIPHPPRLPRLRDHPSTSLQSCLEGALALEQKCGVSSWHLDWVTCFYWSLEVFAEFRPWLIWSAQVILCSNLYKGSTARLELVLDNKTNKLRYIKQTEVEVLMGYPKDYTNVVAHETKGRTEQAEKVLKTPV